MAQSKHYQVLVIGGGTAGIMVAAQLKRKQSSLNIAIIEPSDTHWYQPAFTLVGAGTFNPEKIKRPQAPLIPKGVEWIKDKATLIHAKDKKVSTEKNGDISFDYLVVAPGLVNDFSLIDGLEDALNKGVVCSNYVDPEKTFELVKNFKGGNAIFTQPSTPIKCGGAPQKAMYMSSDYWRKNGVLSKANITFATPGSVIFGVKVVADTLTQVLERYNVELRTFHNPVRIDADQKKVYFKFVGEDKNKMNVSEGNKMGARLTDDGLIEMDFDFLHLAPPQKAPDFIEASEGITNKEGWVDVNINSMQHNTFDYIFSLGDVAALPTAKTGAAIRKQAPVVVDNLMKLMNNQQADNKDYDGYSSCPLVTGFGKMVLAEFDYDNNFTPDPMLKFMLVSKSYKEDWRLWVLKKYMLPYMYWNQMMKGKM